MSNFYYLPYVTEPLRVTEETPEFDFCPDPLVKWYDQFNMTGSTNWVYGNTVGERVELWVIMNRSDYQDAIDAAGYSGDLQLNFQEATICTTPGIPTGLPNCPNPEIPYLITETATEIILK